MTRLLLFIALFVGWNSSVYGQDEIRTRREPVPYYPELIGELVDTTTKPKPDTTNVGGIVASSFVPYMNPTAPPEAARSNALGNIPVNLYTGSPVINLPIYTVTEGRLSIPLHMNYNHSTVKPTTLAGWTGLGFELGGVPSLSRLVRGFPDEGYLEYDGSGFTGRKGYYFYGSSIVTSDKKQDKEPDYFFVNTPSGSGKFIFDRYKKAHFFPEADIKVAIDYYTLPEGGNIAKKFTLFKITFPDGITYHFSSTAPEESAEVEVEDAQNNGIYPYPFNPNPAPFTNFVKQNMVVSAWGCRKIESPYGEKIDLEYERVAYTYYRLADNEADVLCPNSSNISKKINKIYIRSSLLTSIKTSTIELNFNTGYQSCTYNPTTGQMECDYANPIPRYDIDSWGNAPTNSSNSARLLKNIFIKDLGSTSTTEKLAFTFDYEYANATSEITYPSNYSTSDVGTTHKKRLILRKIHYPGEDFHTFVYENEGGGVNHSRFTYGTDHWGYQNNILPNSFYGYIGQDELSTCGNLKEPSIDYAKTMVLSRISHSSGSEVFLEYELNQAKNYTAAVGGLRIKSVVSKDNVRNQSLKKNYSYTMPDNTSSGFLFLKPIYRINYFGLDNKSHTLSNLYDYLNAESGRPIVGYSRVTETTTNLLEENFTGKVVSYFDHDETNGSIKTNPSCTSGCQFNPAYFNQRQPDLRGGQLLKSEVYNQNNILIQKTESVYTPSGGITTDSTYCVQRYPKSKSDWNYYLYFKKFRPEMQTVTTYSPTGGLSASNNITSYTYKDEMPAAYRNEYKGQHNFPVLTTTQNEVGNTLETRMLYTADFSFDSDTAIVCPELNICSFDPDLECPRVGCEEYEITSTVPPYGYEGRAIFEAQQKNILNSVIEQRQTVNGQSVSATYTSLYSDNNIYLTLPKKTFNLKEIPKATFQQAEFVAGNTELLKDSGYGAGADVEIISYNQNGFVFDSKLSKGSTNSKLYLTPVLPYATISNYGKPDALTTSRTFTRKYLGADKTTAPNQLERKIAYELDSGRPLQESDKDNRILRRYQYYSTPDLDNSIAWNESLYSKSCGTPGIVNVSLYVTGIAPPTIAQFSADNGASWQNAIFGNNGYTYSQAPSSNLKTFRARTSNDLSNVITVQKDISCPAQVLQWSINTVTSHTPGFCRYNLSVTGLSVGGVAQFSLDGYYWAIENNGSGEMEYVIPAPATTQQFWARDSNNPSNVITTHLNGCP